MMALWHEAPVKSLDDLKNEEFVVGSFNRPISAISGRC